MFVLFSKVEISAQISVSFINKITNLAVFLKVHCEKESPIVRPLRSS